MKIEEARQLATVLIEAAAKAEQDGREDIDLLDTLSAEADAALAELHAAVARAKPVQG